MVEFGMRPIQVLQTATIEPARLLKKEADLGSISTGKIADLLAIKGDVIDDISLLETVPFVMKDGVIVKDQIQ
jgi:imidazolonepropionase-like amidohydrolase